MVLYAEKGGVESRFEVLGSKKSFAESNWEETVFCEEILQ
jgi:hypothetical protein